MPRTFQCPSETHSFTHMGRKWKEKSKRFFFSWCFFMMILKSAHGYVSPKPSIVVQLSSDVVNVRAIAYDLHHFYPRWTIQSALVLLWMWGGVILKETTPIRMEKKPERRTLRWFVVTLLKWKQALALIINKFPHSMPETEDGDWFFGELCVVYA